MSEVLIVRKSGAVQTLTPTITKVSSTGTSVTFTLTNNDTQTVTLVYRFSSLLTDGKSISLAPNTTTSNITISNIDLSSGGTLFVTGNVAGKIKSEVAEAQYDPIVAFTTATGGTTLEYDDGGKRYRSHTFTSSSSFVVTTAGNGARGLMDYLIIAGGGGSAGIGSFDAQPGGGGAGGYLTTLGPTSGNVANQPKFSIQETSYAILIGAGGNNSNGGNTEVFGITAVGGGRGGLVNNSGFNGGSGGGAGNTNESFGLGIVGQGHNGGPGGPGVLAGRGGGGGGAGSEGISGSSTALGGIGLDNLLRTGSNENRAVGGNGGNTLRGGGGFIAANLSIGGSGGVVIRYEIPTV